MARIARVVVPVLPHHVSQRGNRREIQANQFAAELLMPEFILMEMLQKHSFDLDDEGPLDELARQFRVSRQAMGYRIQNIL